MTASTLVVACGDRTVGIRRRIGSGRPHLTVQVALKLLACASATAADGEDAGASGSSAVTRGGVNSLSNTTTQSRWTAAAFFQIRPSSATPIARTVATMALLTMTCQKEANMDTSRMKG